MTQYPTPGPVTPGPLPSRGTPGGPPRRGIPWWGWLAGGCGCSVLLLVLAGLALGTLGYRTLQSVSQGVGPVTPASVQSSLGADVPVYPGGTLDTTATRASLTALRLAEKAANKPYGTIIRGVGVTSTQDSPDQVFAYYDRELGRNGWKRLARKVSGRHEQTTYQKGNDIAVVQVQPASERGTVVIMRGGQGLMETTRTPETRTKKIPPGAKPGGP